MSERQHPTTAMAVANWFLNRGWSDTAAPAIDQMKLYKLVYYANAWYLGNKCGELYPEDVQAWEHGPVLPSLYSSFKSYGADRITGLGSRLTFGHEGQPTFSQPVYEGELESFLEQVWDGYRSMTGIQLSNMTHGKGEPWTIVAESYRFDLSSKPEIPSELVESVFAERVRQAA